MEPTTPSKDEILRTAAQETEVHLYADIPEIAMDVNLNGRRKSQDNILGNYLNENYIKPSNGINVDHEMPDGKELSRILNRIDLNPSDPRDHRALSEEIDKHEDSKMSNDPGDMDIEIEEMGELDDDDEPDIVLIEEEYKSVLDDNPKELCRQDFEFIKLIGSGAHASVYLAEKIDTKTLYAIKVLNKRDLNKKKQVKGTKIERRILVSDDLLTNSFIEGH